MVTEEEVKSNNDFHNRINTLDPGIHSRINWEAYNKSPSYKAQIDRWLDLLEQNKGSEYFDQILGMNVSANYSPDFWDKLAGFFGVDSGNYGRFFDNFSQGLGSELAEFSSLKREELHNSEAETIARQRAMGINPDLTGLPAGTGSASEASEFPAEALQEQSMAFPDFLKFFQNLGMSFLSSTFNAVRNIKEFQMMDIQRNTGKILQGVEEVGLADKAGELALRDIANSITEAEADDEGNLDLNVLKAAWKKEAPFKNEYANRYYRRYVSEFVKDLEGNETLSNKVMRQKLLDELEEYKVKRAERHSHKWYSDDIEEMSGKIASLFTELQDKLTNIQLQSALDYENSFTDENGNKITSGAARGIADSKSLNVENLIKQFQEETESVWSELSAWLKDKSESSKHPLIYQFGLMFLPILKSLSMQAMVQMLATFKGQPTPPDRTTITTTYGDKPSRVERRVSYD